MPTETETNSAERLHLGPAWVYPIGHIFHSLFFYLGIGLMFLPLLNHFFPLIPTQNALTETPTFNGRYLLLALAIAGVLIIMTVILTALTNFWALSYDYSNSPRPLLYLTHGVVNQQIDNVDLSIVVDCDINRRPLDFFFGTGNLSVRTIDGQKFHLICVSDIFRARDLILARPPLAGGFRGVPPVTGEGPSSSS